MQIAQKEIAVSAATVRQLSDGKLDGDLVLRIGLPMEKDDAPAVMLASESPVVLWVNRYPVRVWVSCRGYFTLSGTGKIRTSPHCSAFDLSQRRGRAPNAEDVEAEGERVIRQVLMGLEREMDAKGTWGEVADHALKYAIGALSSTIYAESTHIMRQQEILDRKKALLKQMEALATPAQPASP